MTKAPNDDLLLLVCIAAGAILGFSLTGSAAVGTALGAGLGIALLARHRRASPARRP